MKKLICVTICAAACALAIGQQASARAPYKTEFDKMYVKKDSTDETEVKFAATVKETNCNVCHVGKNRKDRNSYGKALSAYLTKDDLKKPEKIVDALKKVDAEHSVKDDATSPTFGELLKKHELPGKE